MDTMPKLPTQASEDAESVASATVRMLSLEMYAIELRLTAKSNHSRTGNQEWLANFHRKFGGGLR